MAKLESKVRNPISTSSASDERLRPRDRNDFKSDAVSVEDSRQSCFLAEPGTQRKSWTTAFILNYDAAERACLGGRIRRLDIRAGY